MPATTSVFTTVSTMRGKPLANNCKKVNYKRMPSCQAGLLAGQSSTPGVRHLSTRHTQPASR